MREWKQSGHLDEVWTVRLDDCLSWAGRDAQQARYTSLNPGEVEWVKIISLWEEIPNYNSWNCPKILWKCKNLESRVEPWRTPFNIHHHLIHDRHYALSFKYVGLFHLCYVIMTLPSHHSLCNHCIKLIIKGELKTVLVVLGFELREKNFYISRKCTDCFNSPASQQAC
jgi:hypothetical protein